MRAGRTGRHPADVDLGGQMDHASAATDELGVCPFLRTVADDGSPGGPIGRPHEANRCTALGDAAPQSLRQQKYACLASAHVNCPRFVRGGLDPVEPMAVPGMGLKPTPAIVGALLVLAASFALSVGFVIANGGLDLPAAASRSQQAALASAAPSPGASLAASAVPASPSSAPSAGPAASPEPSATPTATASPTRTNAPALTSAPSPAETPGSSSDRYDLLEPCPDAPDCWIYVVRSGDNLVSIARYFGVPLEVVGDLNPWTRSTSLVAGQELRLPPPTR
jgi:hypothetical protein